MTDTLHTRDGEGKVFCRPLIPLAVALTAGLSLGLKIPGHPAAAWAMILACAAVTLRCALRHRAALAAPLFFCAAVGYLSVQPWLTANLPQKHIGHFIDRGKCTIYGTVDDLPDTGGDSGRIRFVLRASGLRTGGPRDGRSAVHAVHGLVMVSSRPEAPQLRRGDRVRLSGHLRIVRSFCNPGGFDYERFMALRGIRVRLYARPEGIAVLSQGCGAWRQLDQWRRDMAERMQAELSGHPPHTAAVLRAMTLGDSAAVGPDLRDAFNRTGTGHLLAISGLHIGMVAAAVFGPAVWILSRFRWVLRRAFARRGAALVTILPVTGYAVVAGLTPSTQRAALMAAAFLSTFWVGRRHDWLNTLCAAALVILSFSPPAAATISFQLSFAAVAALVAGLGALGGGNDRPASEAGGSGRRLLLCMAASLRVSLLAFLGTLPLSLFYFNQVSLIGPAVNLAVVPLAGILAVPAGLLGVAGTFINDTFANLCWQSAAWALDVMLYVIRTAASWPYAAMRTVTPSMLEIALLYLLLLVPMLPYRHGRYGRVLRIAGLVLVITCGILDAAWWSFQRFGRRTMEVTAIDVGQGSANLLQLPGGATVLIDGGGFSDAGDFDIGARVVAPLLWRNKIMTLDLVVLTHPDSDHLNGLLFILENFKVREIWSNHEGVRTAGFRRFTEIIRARGLNHRPLSDLARGADFGPVRLEVLAPPADFKRLRRQEPWRDPNNDSLVVRAVFDHFSMLFPGDIDEAAETRLSAGTDLERLASKVLVVPHHGSRKSCSDAFLEAVHPEEAVIPAGWRNVFHFPHRDVLERLSRRGCRIRRTDTCGAVRLTTDGGKYHVSTCRGE